MRQWTGSSTLNSEKAHDHVARQILWKMLQEYGASWVLLRAYQSLYDAVRTGTKPMLLEVCCVSDPISDVHGQDI